MIRVVLTGAAGRMGQEAARTLSATEGLELVAVVDPGAAGRDLREVAGPSTAHLTIQDCLSLNPGEADVLVDLTHGAVAGGNARRAVAAGVSPVIGATGIPMGELEALNKDATQAQIPALLVPNFAIGAVLMMRFAQMAAPWLPEVEIIEMHHDGKRDAPSGTANRTAVMIGEARAPRSAPNDGLPARGEVVAGVPVHSVRLPGLVAHQAVLFGGQGETLTIRHDSLDRSSFMPGIVISVRGVRGLPAGLTVGLDALLFGPSE